MTKVGCILSVYSFVCQYITYGLGREKKISACNLSPRRHFFNVFLFFFVACRWFCHFDDDNYVNVPRLVDKLSQFDHRKDWYLGKPSLPEPLEILDRDTNHQQVKHSPDDAQ